MGTAIYGSPEALWARNPRKVSKRSSRACRPGVSKKRRKTPKNLKKSQKGVKISVWGFFGHFFDPLDGAARKDPFETFWGFSGPEGLGTPVYGSFHRNFSGNYSADCWLFQSCLSVGPDL